MLQSEMKYTLWGYVLGWGIAMRENEGTICNPGVGV